MTWQNIYICITAIQTGGLFKHADKDIGRLLLTKIGLVVDGEEWGIEANKLR